MTDSGIDFSTALAPFVDAPLTGTCTEQNAVITSHWLIDELRHWPRMLTDDLTMISPEELTKTIIRRPKSYSGCPNPGSNHVCGHASLIVNEAFSILIDKGAVYEERGYLWDVYDYISSILIKESPKGLGRRTITSLTTEITNDLEDLVNVGDLIINHPNWFYASMTEDNRRYKEDLKASGLYHRWRSPNKRQFNIFREWWISGI